MTWQVIDADCVEQMKLMDEASVDAVVTDPPYGLSFMGKEWDRPGGMARAYHDDEHLASSPHGRARAEHGGASYGKADVLAAQAWHQAWATEALRVLKPGGHLLAFGGTRTYHRLACAIEDAGFEIRDSVIWLYGSGFPKSLDVSKAIDRLNGKPMERMREFGQWMRSQREAAGLTAAQVNRTMEMPQGCGWWEGKGAGDKWDLHPPSLETFARLKKLYEAGDDWDWFVEWAEAERERIGTNPNIERARQSGGEIAFGHGSFDDAITAPATPEAQRWQGFGTSLKPAHEPIVVARKPLIGTVAQNVERFGTGALNIDGTRIGNGRVQSAAGNVDFRPGADDLEDEYEHGTGREYREGGRWPANVALSHLPECQRVGERRVKPVGATAHQKHHGKGQMLNRGEGEAEHPGYRDADGLETVEAWSCVEGCPVRELDRQSGELKSGSRAAGDYGRLGYQGWDEGPMPAVQGDVGHASRFFYVAKSSRSERTAGVGINAHPT